MAIAPGDTMRGRGNAERDTRVIVALSEPGRAEILAGRGWLSGLATLLIVVAITPVHPGRRTHRRRSRRRTRLPPGRSSSRSSGTRPSGDPRLENPEESDRLDRVGGRCSAFALAQVTEIYARYTLEVDPGRPPVRCGRGLVRDLDLCRGVLGASGHRAPLPVRPRRRPALASGALDRGGVRRSRRVRDGAWRRGRSRSRPGSPSTTRSGSRGSVGSSRSPVASVGSGSSPPSPSRSRRWCCATGDREGEARQQIRWLVFVALAVVVSLLLALRRGCCSASDSNDRSVRRSRSGWCSP